MCPLPLSAAFAAASLYYLPETAAKQKRPLQRLLQGASVLTLYPYFAQRKIALSLIIMIMPIMLIMPMDTKLILRLLHEVFVTVTQFFLAVNGNSA